MLRQELVERGKMACLLVVHMLHEGSQMGVRFDNRGNLRRIDQRSGEFTSLIDSEGAVKKLSLLL